MDIRIESFGPAILQFEYMAELQVLVGSLEAAGARHAVRTIVAGGEDLTPALVERVLERSSVETVISFSSAISR